MIAADASPARACAAIITAGPVLMVMIAIATRNTAVIHRNIRSGPNFWPSLAPSMVKPATPSEYATIAVTTVVGAALNSALMPPIETGSALMFHDICAWPIAIAAIGSQEVFCVGRDARGGAAVHDCCSCRVPHTEARLTSRRPRVAAQNECEW